MPKEEVKVSVAAAELGITPQGLWFAIRVGKIPARQRGGRGTMWFIKRSDLEAFKAARGAA